MKTLALIGSVILAACISGDSPTIHQGKPVAPRRPFPQHVAYAAGTIAPNYRQQSQLDADVRAFYEVWKSRYLVAVQARVDGAPLYRVTFGTRSPERTVSEGQGYGMMIVAWMAGHDPDAQAIFDGLWRFSREYPSAGDRRLMGWEVPPDADGAWSAFDGDADIAYALLLADAQWGSSGSVDYRTEARRMIAAIGESTIGPKSHLPTLGDWVGRKHTEKYDQYSVRTSDFMPSHFAAFRNATSDRRWGRVLAAIQSTITSLQATHSPATGLLPDFIVSTSRRDRTPRPAPPHFLEKETDGAYSYNAGRVPWRVGFHALLRGDTISRSQVLKISRWAERAAGGDPRRIRAGYALDGMPLQESAYFSTFFVAPLGVAAMNDPEQQAWLNAIYDAVHATHQDYYEDSITLLSLLVMTRNAWEPS